MCTNTLYKKENLDIQLITIYIIQASLLSYFLSSVHPYSELGLDELLSIRQMNHVAYLRDTRIVFMIVWPHILQCLYEAAHVAHVIKWQQGMNKMLVSLTLQLEQYMIALNLSLSSFNFSHWLESGNNNKIILTSFHIAISQIVVKFEYLTCLCTNTILLVVHWSSPRLFD